MAAAAAAASECPPANFSTATGFDLDAFISGRWYVQQQMEVLYLPRSQNACVYADYARRSPGFLGYEVAVHNHAEDALPPYAAHDSGSTLCAKVVDAASGKLAVAPCFLPPSLFAGPYWVLAFSQEEGYALISGGAPTKPSSHGGCSTGRGVNNAGLWIFTRGASRDQALVDKVRGIAAAKGFDLSVLNDVDQSRCTAADEVGPAAGPAGTLTAIV
uniref:Lipocalin/cytosolic fatty-acid binding domain-containing protein n=1 Tax=Zooxanthella nutricula TaxID=1333877 RepID=A0A7S2QN00_9DINO